MTNQQIYPIGKGFKIPSVEAVTEFSQSSEASRTLFIRSRTKTIIHTHSRGFVVRKA
jgi:hypothetical protein